MTSSDCRVKCNENNTNTAAITSNISEQRFEMTKKTKLFANSHKYKNTNSQSTVYDSAE